MAKPSAQKRTTMEEKHLRSSQKKRNEVVGRNLKEYREKKKGGGALIKIQGWNPVIKSQRSLFKKLKEENL